MSRGFRRSIWFWQKIVSPHMIGLAESLTHLGCDVVYVAEQMMTHDRINQGWLPPDVKRVRLELLSAHECVDKIVASAPRESIHICSGVRGNRLIGAAQTSLKRNNRRQWVIMETVDDKGLTGFMKRIEYSRQFSTKSALLEGVLAIGHSTPAWVSARGMATDRVFPFAYFLPSIDVVGAMIRPPRRKYRFLFVGQFIELKRLDLLILALQKLLPSEFELTVVGSGPLESEWRKLATSALPGCIEWVGRMPLDSVRVEMRRADCLVLPSRHDGWGAVISEALMVGTPVICSHACGASEVVQASGFGGVFPTGDLASLVSLLERMMSKGALAECEKVALLTWARCLSGQAGASYLMKILNYTEDASSRPLPPWRKEQAMMGQHRAA